MDISHEVVWVIDVPLAGLASILLATIAVPRFYYAIRDRDWFDATYLVLVAVVAVGGAVALL